jgi:hypothetical protein
MRIRSFLIICPILLFISSSCGYAQIDYDERNGVFVNFDDDNYAWAKWDCAVPNTAQFSVVDNPDPSGINTSEKVGRFLTSACTYEGAACMAKFKPIDFSEKSYFRIKVYAPDAEMTFLFKLEDYDDNSIFYEVGAITNTYDEWEELIFDFSDAPSNTYQQIVVLPDFGGEDQYDWYFDDIRLTDEEDTDTEHSIHIINTYHLSQNHPNPFNPRTTIPFSIEKPSLVQIKIYDISGRLIKILVDEKKSAGNYSTIWDGRNEQSKLVSSGYYFYTLKTDNQFTVSKRMILLK